MSLGLARLVPLVASRASLLARSLLARNAQARDAASQSDGPARFPRCRMRRGQRQLPSATR